MARGDVKRLLDLGVMRFKRIHGFAMTPASFRTHIMIQCNTNGVCRYHREGGIHWHRVRRDSIEAMKEVLGR